MRRQEAGLRETCEHACSKDHQGLAEMPKASDEAGIPIAKALIPAGNGRTIEGH